METNNNYDKNTLISHTTKKPLFICHTYYHVLVVLVKTLISEVKPDIIICDRMDEYEQLIKNLKDSALFENVFFYSEKTAEANKLKAILKGRLFRLFINYYIRKYCRPSFELTPSLYDVYIYNDNTSIGFYLRSRHIYYHLLEDATDSYKHYNTGDFLNINYDKTLKEKLFSFAYETFYFYGKSKYSLSIEVNDSEGIGIPKKNSEILEKVKLLNKKELFKKPNEKQKQIILDVFMRGKDIYLPEGESALILTQPFYHAGIGINDEAHYRLYKDIVDEYCKGLSVVFKLHRSDYFDYSARFENITTIDRSIPVEVLNYMNTVKFKKAITVTSAGILLLEISKEVLYLGMDWVNKYRTNK